MEIIQKLKEHSLWEAFMEYRISGGNMSKRDREDLKEFVLNKEYVKYVERLETEPEFSLPRMIEVNKSGVKKKRVVFSFGREENYILKMIAYLLKEYDGLFCSNLYSFRNHTGVKRAIGRIVARTDFETTYSYKADIHDYFNSIHVDRILEMFAENLPDEKWLLSFLERMLKNPYAMKEEERITVKKGVMAGTPTAGFLANLYLSDMDRYFYEKRVLYARYSDDIIVFSDKKEEIEEYEAILKGFLQEKGLEINPAKEVKTGPGEKIEFLGFAFSANEINISDMAKKKMKGKIKRKARALYRWKIRKSADNERTARAFIRCLNHKFYSNALRDEITWCRWYFPMITTDTTLKEVDDYAISNIRYLYTGKHGKKNFDLKYSDIRELGYKSLVNNFWKFKAGKYFAEEEG